MTIKLDDKINERLQQFCDKHLGGSAPTIGLLNDMAEVFGHKLRVTIEPEQKTPEQTYASWNDR